MVKKLMVGTIVTIMLLGVFGLTGCDDISLVDYKSSMSIELQAYADTKYEANNYCAEGLVAIANAVEAGKAAIEDATTKPAVTRAFNDAKGVIDAVEWEDNGLQAGFILISGEPEPPIRCAFTSEKSKIKLGDDLVINFYYGYPKGTVSGDVVFNMFAKIVLSSNYEFVVDIKTIDDFTIENYPWNHDMQTGVLPTVEQIIIDKSLFVGEKGYIGISIVEYSITEEGGSPERGGAGGITIYYKVVGETVFLAKSPIL